MSTPELGAIDFSTLLPWVVKKPPASDSPTYESLQLGTLLSPPIFADTFHEYLTGKGGNTNIDRYSLYWVTFNLMANYEVLGLIGKSGTAQSTPEISVIPRKDILSDKFRHLPNITLELTENSIGIYIHSNQYSIPVSVYELEVINQRLPIPPKQLKRKDKAWHTEMDINTDKYLVLTSGTIPFAAIAHENTEIIDDKPPAISARIILSSELFR